MSQIPIEHQSDAKTKIIELKPLNSSILGLKWILQSDSLEISRGPQKEIPSVVTQKAELSHVTAFFDSLCLFGPYTMRMRIPDKTF